MCVCPPVSDVNLCFPNVLPKPDQKIEDIKDTIRRENVHLDLEERMMKEDDVYRKLLTPEQLRTMLQTIIQSRRKFVDQLYKDVKEDDDININTKIQLIGDIRKFEERIKNSESEKFIAAKL